MRAFLGLGGTVDYEIVWDRHILESLAVQYGIGVADLDQGAEVDSERALVCNILEFFARGAGGERFVATSAIIESFARRFPLTTTLGGTSVRAALAMNVVGVRSGLHLVSIDDHVRRLLPREIDYICSAEQDTFDPHLIVQYTAGDEVALHDAVLRAPHPNRLIYANDPPNRELVIHPDLPQVLAETDVFLISGFNVIQDEALLHDRLSRVEQAMDRLPGDAFVFFEEAAYHRPEFSGPVRDVMVRRADVISMNEDELQGILAREVDQLDPADVRSALVDLRALIPARTLVVHSKYWALAYGPDAARYGASLQGGITMASARYCFGDALTLEQYLTIGSLVPGDRATRFAQEMNASMGTEMCCVPAFVLDVEKPTMIGLGDTFVGGFLASRMTADALDQNRGVLS